MTQAEHTYPEFEGKDAIEAEKNMFKDTKNFVIKSDKNIEKAYKYSFIMKVFVWLLILTFQVMTICALYFFLFEVGFYRTMHIVIHPIVMVIYIGLLRSFYLLVIIRKYYISNDDKLLAKITIFSFPMESIIGFAIFLYIMSKMPV